MTVNTLGSDSRIGGDSVTTQKPQNSRTVAEWLWPLLTGGVALFVISALFYYHFYLVRDAVAPTSFLQHTIVGIYNVFGLAPSVVFFLMVFAWSSIWAVTGILERPLARLGRLLVMALMVGVFLNLGSGGVASDVHTGSLGAWIANRLVVGIGYVFSIVLVGPTMFASLMLATDWFFSEWFERDRKTTNFETGVEPGVTDHLRGLSGVANRPQQGLPSKSDAADEGVDQQAIAEQLQRAAAAAMAEPTVVVAPAPQASPEPAVAGADAGADATGGDVANSDADPAVIVPSRPLSYAERRRQRAERRSEEGAAVGAELASDHSLEASGGVSGGVSGGAAEPQQAAGAVLVTEAELETLFDADPAAVAIPESAADAFEDDLADEVEDSVGVEDAADADLADEDLAAEDGEVVDDESEDEEELEDEESEGEGDEEEFEDEESEDEDDEEEFEDEESEDEDDEEEFEDEESEDEDDEEEFEDEESEDEDDEEEFEDEESEDEDDEEDEGEDEDEQELEEAGLDEEEESEELVDDVDVESAELEDEEDAEFEDEPDEDVDEEDLTSEVTPSDHAIPVAANADEPADYAEEEAEEEIVSIPRPDEAPALALPTPPEMRKPEEVPSSRQQQLFDSQIDDDLMAEAVELLSSGRRATATLLQRKLRIDYELAVKVLSELASRGLVSGDGDRS